MLKSNFSFNFSVAFGIIVASVITVLTPTISFANANAAAGTIDQACLTGLLESAPKIKNDLKYVMRIIEDKMDQGLNDLGEDEIGLAAQSAKTNAQWILDGIRLIQKQYFALSQMEQGLGIETTSTGESVGESDLAMAGTSDVGSTEETETTPQPDPIVVTSDLVDYANQLQPEIQTRIFGLCQAFYNVDEAVHRF